MQTLPEFLTQKYLDWQAAQGEIKTLEEYAEYLGVNRSLLSFWMNGKRVPNEENIDRMSLKLGNEIYDVLDLPRPNPYLQLVNRAWAHLPEEIQIKISEEVDRNAQSNLEDQLRKSSKRTAKARGK